MCIFPFILSVAPGNSGRRELVSTSPLCGLPQGQHWALCTGSQLEQDVERATFTPWVVLWSKSLLQSRPSLCANEFFPWVGNAMPTALSHSAGATGATAERLKQERPSLAHSRRSQPFSRGACGAFLQVHSGSASSRCPRSCQQPGALPAGPLSSPQPRWRPFLPGHPDGNGALHRESTAGQVWGLCSQLTPGGQRGLCACACVSKRPGQAVGASGVNAPGPPSLPTNLLLASDQSLGASQLP